ncbi:MAG: hypothetical protein KK926_10410 [Methanomethylovorans sp.]|nr:hypothetical protein [Methanomethylovorans sp.]
MKKSFFLILALLLIAAFLIGTGVEKPDSDEKYHGEDEEQPGSGVDTGSGDTNAPDSPGDRTRFKDR